MRVQETGAGGGGGVGGGATRLPCLPRGSCDTAISSLFRRISAEAVDTFRKSALQHMTFYHFQQVCSDDWFQKLAQLFSAKARIAQASAGLTNTDEQRPRHDAPQRHDRLLLRVRQAAVTNVQLVRVVEVAGAGDIEELLGGPALADGRVCPVPARKQMRQAYVP